MIVYKFQPEGFAYCVFMTLEDLHNELDVYISDDSNVGASFIITPMEMTEEEYKALPEFWGY